MYYKILNFDAYFLHRALYIFPLPFAFDTRFRSSMLSFVRAIYFSESTKKCALKVHRSRQEGERFILQEVHDPWITLATNASL